MSKKFEEEKQEGNSRFPMKIRLHCGVSGRPNDGKKIKEFEINSDSKIMDWAKQVSEWISVDIGCVGWCWFLLTRGSKEIDRYEKFSDVEDLKDGDLIMMMYQRKGG